MVKKLLKHEFSALSKTLLPMYIVLFSIALFNRVAQFFENEGTPYTISIVSSSILLGIAAMVCIVYTVAVCIVRFYKNLYTAQGYLTLTLPVTHSDHIFAKLISAVLASLASFVAVFLSITVSTAGDVFGELIKAAAYIARRYFKWAKGNGVFFIIEFVLVCLLSVILEYLIIYTCITLGQLANKNRVLAAFGIYFGVYIIWQIIGTVFIIITSTIINSAFIEKIYMWIANNPFAFIHILFCGSALIMLALCVLCFFITHIIMKNRLNLE